MPPSLWAETFSFIKKSVWWLSVDNHFKAVKNYGEELFNFKNIQNQQIMHFAVSKYVEDFLVQNGARSVYRLSNYINGYFFKKEISERQNIVLYNPRKGIEATNSIIALLPSVKFAPIENLNRRQVSSLLRKGKVYIDFGNHPGKEHIPREAAISGCCVITGFPTVLPLFMKTCRYRKVINFSNLMI